MLTISGSKEKEKVSEAACLAGSKTCSYYSNSMIAFRFLQYLVVLIL